MFLSHRPLIFRSVHPPFLLQPVPSPPLHFSTPCLPLPILFSQDILPITISKPFVTGLQRALCTFPFPFPFFPLFLLLFLFPPKITSTFRADMHHQLQILPIHYYACDCAPAYFMPQAGGGDDPILQETPTLQALWECKQIPASYSCRVVVVNLVVG